jgi:glycerophosphoryl diester phosphodiesterase
MNQKPLIIAHRGFSGKFPENTIKSINEAIIVGSDLIEVDLQLTKDNEVVLFHDETLERILKNEKNKSIVDYTLKELKSKDFGSWFNPKYADCKIPTLQEILDLRRDSSSSFDFILEIKTKIPNLLIPRVKEILKQNKYTFDTGYLSVRDKESFEIAKRNNFRNDKIGLMQKKRTPTEIINLTKNLQAGYIQLRPIGWTEEDWISLKMNKIQMTVFYGDTIIEYENFIKKGVYGIFTNFPDKLKDFLQLNT